MLARNTSIVKDTLSKLWKLSNIVRDRALMKNEGEPRISPTKLVPSKALEDEPMPQNDEDMDLSTGLE